ncbi:map/microtubule affinity-regulating kinase 2,4 [Anopheles sinensis]|uniref:Map/microtubule affinity-regulating kinase 2,4 n=1 Tax=Anopheles sinensis TaxID=74873 RepID=A0A084WJ06_ANOSI|nr:map/microtubule affinity-regulating kinase 2,4 [Anopheles sinensis]
MPPATIPSDKDNRLHFPGMFRRDRLSIRAKLDPETAQCTPELVGTSVIRHTLARLSCKDLQPGLANGFFGKGLKKA